MIGRRALLAFAPGVALIVVGTAMGLSNSGSTTLADASAMSASPAGAGETRNADSSAASPASKPAAVAAASSILENDKRTTEITNASPSGVDGTGGRAMKPTVVAPAVRIGGTSSAPVAAPRYDIPKICEQIAGTQGGVMAEMSRQACMDAEHSARRDLMRRWSSIPEAIRKDCNETERALGLAGSYAALQSCIRANITAAQWRKTNPDGAAGASAGPGSVRRSQGSSALRTSLE